MSMTKAAVLTTTSSAISLIAGLYVGYYLTNQRVTESYELILEEQVTKAKAFYSQRNKTGEYSDPVALAEKLVAEDEEPEEEELNVVDQTGIRPADPEDILHKQAPEDRIAYNKISEDYKGPAVKRETYSRSTITPGPSESMEDFERRVVVEAQARVASVIDRSGETNLHEEVKEVEKSEVNNIFDTNKVESLEHEMKRTRDTSRPYIVTREEFEENAPMNTQTTVTWYEGDETLSDEADKTVDEVGMVLGIKNLQFGNGSGDPNIVYIRNDAMELDFEVCLDNGTYTEEVLGISPLVQGPQAT